MSTYFDAPVSGTGNGTIAISTKTLNNGSSVRGAVLSVSNGEKSVNSTLSQRFKPIFRRNGSGDISGSGGTMSVSVNSSYPFWFRNNPDNVSAITYGSTDYKNVNPISSGSYTFNVSIMGNSSSARTDTLEMAFQKINGSYSFNNPDATDFQIVYSQESGSTPTPPEPPTPSGTSINVPIYFDSDGTNIYIKLGQTLPFVVTPAVSISYRQGQSELITYYFAAGEDTIDFDNGYGQPFYVSDFDTGSMTNYVSIDGVYAGAGAPEYTVTYGDTEYYIYWSEDYSANFRTYLENVGNNCLYDVVWGTEPDVPIDYSTLPFTIEAISGGTLSWMQNKLYTNMLLYSLNDGSWTEWGGSINLNAGDKISFKRNPNQGASTTSAHTITYSGEFNVYGKILSLLYANWENAQTLPLNGTKYLSYMFSGSSVISAEHLILAQNTKDYCYQGMFYDCHKLEKAPELPASAMSQYCYSGMFAGCNSLTTAPALPSMALANYCYSNMFRGCTSLVNVPSTLPATTLGYNSYRSMFENCTSLTTAPELPATTLANSCYYSMFYGCNSLANAPELPAPTLAEMCYYMMFRNCSNLSYIKCLATDVSASYCTFDWVNNISSTGTFVKDANMSSWGTGNSGIPNGWTVVDAT